MQTGNTDCIYKNDPDMAYGKCKDLPKRTESDEVLKDKAYKITSNPNYDGYQRGLASTIYKFLIKNL